METQRTLTTSATRSKNQSAMMWVVIINKIIIIIILIIIIIITFRIIIIISIIIILLCDQKNDPPGCKLPIVSPPYHNHRNPTKSSSSSLSPFSFIHHQIRIGTFAFEKLTLKTVAYTNVRWSYYIFTYITIIVKHFLLYYIYKCLVVIWNIIANYYHCI